MSARARQYAAALDCLSAAYGALRDAQEEYRHGTEPAASERAQRAAWDRARAASQRLVRELARDLTTDTPTPEATNAQQA